MSARLAVCGEPSSPPAVADRLAGAHLILHAGDVCTPQVLNELSAFAPVRVLLSNNDSPEVAAWGAQETLELDLDDLQVAMIHNAGTALDAGTPGPTGQIPRGLLQL